MKKIIFSLLAGFIAFTACSPDDDGDEPQPSGNEPVNGSEWVYKITDYNESGDATATYNVTLVASEVTIGNSTWLSLVEQESQSPVIAMKKKSDGWWYSQPPETGSSLWYKTPAQAGDTYPYLYGTCTVNDVNASVSIPAGNFTNVSYIEGHDDNSLEDEFWFADGPVLVKYNTYDAYSGQPESNVYKKQSWELVSFTR